MPTMRPAGGQEWPTWESAGSLDDDSGSWGRTVCGYPVLGGQAWLGGAETMPYVALGIGSPAVKARIAEALRGRCAGFPTLVHPTVVKSSRVQLADGVIVTAGNILTTEVSVAEFVTLNLMCTVGHDCEIGRYVTVAPGVNISGNVRIGEGCDVGTGSAVVQGLSIGAWTVVGAGAVVSRDLPDNCTAVGVPAKPIKFREPGWQFTRGDATDRGATPASPTSPASAS